MTVADGGGGHRRPFGAELPYPTLCGHELNDMGECAEPGCENRWQLCPQCGPGGGAESAQDARGRASGAGRAENAREPRHGDAQGHSGRTPGAA
jgi:hypothetical protein